MLLDPPPREPPENPPPPPRALANETVGTPMSAQTMQEAISFLVITSDVLSVAVVDPAAILHHPNRSRQKKPRNLWSEWRVRSRTHDEDCDRSKSGATAGRGTQAARRLRQQGRRLYFRSNSC